MDLSQLAMEFIPLPVLLFVFGASYVAKRWLTNTTGKIAGEEGELPRWFLAIPFTLGILAGSMYYLSENMKDIIMQPVISTVLKCLWTGAGFAGASVLLWEGTKTIKEVFTLRKGSSNGPQ